MKKQIKLPNSPRSEAQHQIKVINWTLIHMHEYPELEMLYHTPNGGKRETVEAKRLKDMGTKPGVPDLCLPVPRGPYHGLYIEMKTEQGHTTEKQEYWGANLQAQGYRWRVCHGWNAAVAELEWYLNLGAFHG